MKLKIMLTLTATYFAAFAQDINGVSLGGTVENPTIVNNSGKAVIGWTITRLDAAGNQLPAHRMVMAGELVTKDHPGFQPGTENAVPKQNTIHFEDPRPNVAASLKLDSVVFVDGEVAGPDTMAPEFPALEGFTEQMRSIQQERPGMIRPMLVVPHVVGNVPSPYVGLPPPQYYPEIFNGLYTPANGQISGTIFGTTYGVNTPPVGASGICGPPYDGYGVGQNIVGTIFCPYVYYAGTAYFATGRPDGYPDRIFETMKLYDAATNVLQNSALFREVCAYSDPRNPPVTFGKAVQVWNYSYGCL